MTTEANVQPGAETENLSPVDAETDPQAAADTTADPEADAKPETPEEIQAKATKALQRRVDRLTRARYAERARAEQAERELAALKQRATDPEEKPAEVDVDARADELLRQRELQGKVRDVLTKGKALENFEAAASLAIEEMGLVDGKGQPTPSLYALLETESPHELLHYIGSNPEIAESLAGMTPTRLAVRLSNLEADMKAAKAPKTSAAPKPIKPVTGAAVTDGEYSPTMTDAQFAAMRKRQIEARR